MSTARQRADVPAPRRGPRLGLVCITAGEAVRFRTHTRVRLLAMTAARQRQVLDELYADNLRRLRGALEFCAARRIRLYRMLSNPFPLCDERSGERALEALAPRLAEIGPLAEKLGIRVVAHPDQFVVLNSESPKVVATSIHILNRQANLFELMRLPRTTWSAITLHGGKGGRADELVRAIDLLDEPARLRLTLENDERAYSADQILDICGRSGTPMVFDAHHHVIKEGLDSFEEATIAAFVRAAAKTWPRRAWQIVHLSNGASGIRDARHSQLISTWPSAYQRAPWIEVEAKGKELAIDELRRLWPAAR